MGLDIMFYKTHKDEKCVSVSDYYHKMSVEMKEEMKALKEKWISELNDDTKNYSDTYHRIFFEEMPKLFPCDEWVYRRFKEEESSKEETIKWIEKTANVFDYPQEHAYFRKVNFIYQFFRDKLEEECCFVTKDDLNELISRCRAIMETDGKLNKLMRDLDVVNDQIQSSTTQLARLAMTKENTEEEQNHLNVLREQKQNIEEDIKSLDGMTGNCENLLPTTSGFFFGSTDYDKYYFNDVEDCYNQMSNLLKDFDEENEVIFVEMSW